jgi:hypothetical protein
MEIHYSLAAKERPSRDPGDIELNTGEKSSAREKESRLPVGELIAARSGRGRHGTGIAHIRPKRGIGQVTPRCDEKITSGYRHSAFLELTCTGL